MTADVPPELRVTASSDDGVIMGIAHNHHLLFGVQFHPESFMTEHGFALIDNFLRTGPHPMRKNITEASCKLRYQLPISGAQEPSSHERLERVG
jgi:GMP synthase-like glutamine amidotransferase